MSDEDWNGKAEASSVSKTKGYFLGEWAGNEEEIFPSRDYHHGKESQTW